MRVTCSVAGMAAVACIVIIAVVMAINKIPLITFPIAQYRPGIENKRKAQ